MRIAFLQFGAGGDILQATIICRKLRELYPNDEIVWICLDIYRDFIKNNPDIDSYIAWPLVPGLSRQQQEVQRWNEIKQYAYENFDKVIAPQYWPDHVADWSRNLKETLLDLMIEYAGLGPVENRKIIYDCNKKDESVAIDFMKKNKLEKRNFICVAPYANSVGRLLKASDYIELQKHLRDKKVIFFGSKNDELLSFGVNALGTSIGVMYALFKRSSGFIGLESAPAIMCSNIYHVPMIVLRNPLTFDLNKIGLIACKIRIENITEIIIRDNIRELFSHVAHSLFDTMPTEIEHE